MTSFCDILCCKRILKYLRTSALPPIMSMWYHKHSVSVCCSAVKALTPYYSKYYNCDIWPVVLWHKERDFRFHLCTAIVDRICRIEKPPYRPANNFEKTEMDASLASVINQSWEENPDDRPSFEDISKTLRSINKGKFVQLSISKKYN